MRACSLVFVEQGHEAVIHDLSVTKRLYGNVTRVCCVLNFDGR